MGKKRRIRKTVELQVLRDVPVASLRGAYVHAVAWTSDGGLVVAGEGAKGVAVLDADSGEERAFLRRPRAATTYLRLSPDGETLVLGGVSPAAYDFASGTRRATLGKLRRSPAGTGFAPDGKTFALTQGKTIRFYDTESWKVIQRVRHSHTATGSLCWLDSERLLAELVDPGDYSREEQGFVERTSSLYLVDRSGELGASSPPWEDVYLSWAVSPAAGRVFVRMRPSRSNDVDHKGRVVVLDLETLEFSKELSPGALDVKGFYGVGLVDEQGVVSLELAVDEARYLRLWNLKTGKRDDIPLDRDHLYTDLFIGPEGELVLLYTEEECPHLRFARV